MISDANRLIKMGLARTEHNAVFALEAISYFVISDLFTETICIIFYFGSNRPRRCQRNNATSTNVYLRSLYGLNESGFPNSFSLLQNDTRHTRDRCH